MTSTTNRVLASSKPVPVAKPGGTSQQVVLLTNGSLNPTTNGGNQART
jgi:hypothetical protein